MAAITSQLEVAYNLSSLCRHVISGADEDAQQHTDATFAKDAGNLAAKESKENGPSTTQGQLRGGAARETSSSFLTEVPTKPSGVSASDSMLSQPRHPPAAAQDGSASEREAVAPRGRAQVQDQVVARQAPGPEVLQAGAGEEKPEAGPVEESSTAVPPRHYPGGVPMQQLSLGSGHANSREERRASSKAAALETLHEGGVENDGDGDRFQAPRTERSPAGAGSACSEEGTEAGPIDGERSRVVSPRQYPGGVSTQQRLSSGTGRGERRESSHELRGSLHEGGIENGGDRDGHRLESAASQSLGYGKQTPDEENTIAEDIVSSSSWSSIVSQGQRALEHERPEDEAANAAEEAPSSWSSMLSIGRSDHEGEHPSVIAEEESPSWSDYICEQPSTLPEAKPVKANLNVNHSTGEESPTSSLGGGASDEGRKSDVNTLLQDSAALAGAGRSRTELSLRTTEDREQTPVPGSDAGERKWPQDRVNGRSQGGGIVETTNASASAQGATRHGGLTLDADQNERNGLRSRTTVLNRGGDEAGDIDVGGAKSASSATEVGGELGRINVRLPSGIFAPNPQPEAEADPYGDGDWEDMGDEEDGGLDGGSWSSWIGAAGGG